MVDGLQRDATHALRGLLARKTYSLVSIVTLALPTAQSAVRS